MNRSEAARVLAKAQAFDRRTVGEVDVEAWAEALADVSLPEALAAVTKHYQTETAWLMPAHLLRTLADNKFRLSVLLQIEGQPNFPAGLAADDERGYRMRYQTHLLRGMDHDEATRRADDEFEIDRGELVPAPPEFRAALEAMNAKRGLDYSRKVGY